MKSCCENEKLKVDAKRSSATHSSQRGFVCLYANVKQFSDGVKQQDTFTRSDKRKGAVCNMFCTKEEPQHM